MAIPDPRLYPTLYESFKDEIEAKIFKSFFIQPNWLRSRGGIPVELRIREDVSKLRSVSVAGRKWIEDNRCRRYRDEKYEERYGSFREKPVMIVPLKKRSVGQP